MSETKILLKIIINQNNISFGRAAHYVVLLYERVDR